MRKIYKLIWKSYAGPGIATFFIVVFVLLMQFLWRYVDDLVGKGLDWKIIGELMFYASFTFVPLALPLSILLSSLMTFGNLGERYELVAIKAAGISLRKVMMPLIIFSVIVSIGAFFYSNTVLPFANLKFRTILHDVRQKKSAFNIREGIFYSGLDGYSIKIGKKDSDGSTIRNVVIYDHSGNRGNSMVILADSGKMQKTGDQKFMLFTLYNGSSYEDLHNRNSSKNLPFQRTYFKKEVLRFDLSQFQLTRTNEEFFKSAQYMLNIDQLSQSADSIQEDVDKRVAELRRSLMSYYHFFGSVKLTDSLYEILATKSQIPRSIEKIAVDSSRLYSDALNVARNVKGSFEFNRQVIKEREGMRSRFLIEWHRKFTLSLACLALFLIGAPLGTIIRKGGLGMPLVVSVLLFVLYHVISFTGEKASRSVLEPWKGMWISTLVFLPIGIFLMYKASTDSALLDAESYLKFFRKISSIFRRTKPDGNENTPAVQ